MTAFIMSTCQTCGYSSCECLEVERRLDTYAKSWKGRKKLVEALRTHEEDDDVMQNHRAMNDWCCEILNKLVAEQRSSEWWQEALSRTWYWDGVSGEYDEEYDEGGDWDDEELRASYLKWFEIGRRDAESHQGLEEKMHPVFFSMIDEQNAPSNEEWQDFATTNFERLQAISAEADVCVPEPVKVYFRGLAEWRCVERRLRLP